MCIFKAPKVNMPAPEIKPPEIKPPEEVIDPLLGADQETDRSPGLKGKDSLKIDLTGKPKGVGTTGVNLGGIAVSQSTKGNK